MVTIPHCTYPEIKAVKVILPDCPAESVPRFRVTVDHERLAHAIEEALYTRFDGKLSVNTTPEIAIEPLFAYCNVYVTGVPGVPV